MTPPKTRTASFLLAAASAGLLSQGNAATGYDDVSTDLSNNPASPTPLSFNSFSGVNPGQLTVGSDTTDALNLTGLLAGSTLDVFATWTPSPANAPDGDIFFNFRNSAGGSIGVATMNSTSFEIGSGNRNMQVPGDGIVQMLVTAGLENGGWNYTLSFEGIAAPVPEPATTAAAAAAGLAALLELRRRRAAN
jgi:hypothetical protein